MNKQLCFGLSTHVFEGGVGKKNKIADQILNFQLKLSGE